jgi:protein-tyrosine phosphatase
MSTEDGPTKTVLFLCTGNYYRSRFAEELFNHRSAGCAPEYLAISRALAIERGINNPGPLSRFAIDRLRSRGVTPKGDRRFPRQCVLEDLQRAQYVVALNEPEHRPLMRERFPQWETQIQYWNIEDVDYLDPKIALAAIDAEVNALLKDLGGA